MSREVTEVNQFSLLFFQDFSSRIHLLSPFPPPGYFTQISTLADVQENVMEYLHVLSRPKVIDQEHDTVWTEAYIDSTVSPGLSPAPAPLVHQLGPEMFSLAASA